MLNNNTRREREEDLLTSLLQRFLPFWPLFAVLLILSFAAAWTYLRYATPIYEAEATIIINDEKKGVDGSKIMESINVFDSKKIVENEIEVIQSRDLMNEVIYSLYLYAPIYEEQNLKDKSAYTTSPVVVELRNPEKIPFNPEEPIKIYFAYNQAKKTIEIDGKFHPLNKWIEGKNFGEFKFIPNPHQTTLSDNQLFFMLVHPKAVTNNSLDNLEVGAPDKLSTIVNLNYKDPVPGRSENILNQLISAYNQASIADRNSLARNTLAFIEDRMANVENELNTLEQEIQQYRSNKGAIDLSEQGRLYLQDVGENDRKIADIELQLAILDNVENYVVSKGNSGGIVPSTVGINDPVLTQLIERLYDSEIKYERLSKTTAENNPILASVANEIEKIRPGILENVSSQRQNLEEKLKNLNSTNRQFSSNLRTIPEQERALLEISRRKAIKNDLFSYLLQKREETALSYAPHAGDSRVIDKAEASLIPVSPKSKMTYAIAILFAFGLGTLYVIFKEVLNRNILFRSELEKATDIPIVGEFTQLKHSKNKKQTKEQETLLSEQFRDLRLALGLYGESAKRKILITSSIEGEGKSFISENLAVSLANSGKRVILLNFDLLKPKFSKIFGVSNEEGISEYLQGKVRLDDIIRPTEHKNLSVIPPGNMSEEVSQNLLDSDIQSLFKHLESVFHYVVVDCPPVNIVLHAYLLSKYCDTSLFVIRHNHTPKSLVRRFDEDPSINAMNNVLLLFNGVKNRGATSGNYGYNYGYSHIKRTYHTSL
ncbi:GumC family protein [Autumnicola musiva]|uniref:Polysaccharide biosynthesis tyrosine autokinase n=1 Tax=Autumnicola musiva TaxID=3075589 RepID=A0ABU3D838_9FLAO|nr:polysaccharide biosynthesis tyrosine autokinase [Zunongwangia sp. F117]MDT0677698.1 polysaccharide biosynthesis tyrosine autokinase [Zunongwangia sp. F117]